MPILLDKLLYDTDRAIDLYTLGSDTAGNGEPEWRAAAFGLLTLEFLSPSPTNAQPASCLTSVCFPRIGELRTALETIRDRLIEFKLTATGAIDALVVPSRQCGHADHR